jgi:hypothetical protein
MAMTRELAAGVPTLDETRKSATRLPDVMSFAGVTPGLEQHDIVAGER